MIPRVIKSVEFRLLTALRFGVQDNATLIILTGDRLSCCDEAVVLYDGDLLVGAATIAPLGEESVGQPSIVGVCVHPQYRGRGFGQQLLLAAVERMRERQLTAPYRVDIVSKMGKRLIEKSSAEVRRYLDVKDLSAWSME